MTGAVIYSMTCRACGFLEEHRVEGIAEPEFNMVNPRRIRDAGGVELTVAGCPLCGGRVLGEVRVA
ncbi:hypothetical protein [Leucobacter chromiireducens]|uniref:hypothetical protein n=1 Tax=Leucobacter chromiireducens TaxID=283877 RepID=UPI003F7E7F78